MEHFQRVRDAIWDARVQYHNIGIELGMSPDSVDAISDDMRGNVGRSFAEVLRRCLSNGISQKKIADALQSRIIGYGHLGREFLAMKFVTKPHKEISAIGSKCVILIKQHNILRLIFMT